MGIETNNSSKSATKKESLKVIFRYSGQEHRIFLGFFLMMSTTKLSSFLLSGSVRFSAQNAAAKNFWTTSVVGEPPKPPTSITTPERPKRPGTPYIMFAVQNGKSLEGKASDKAKQLGRQWGEMNEEAKRPYISQFEAEKKKYLERMKTFMAQLEKDGNVELFKASEVMAKSEARIRKLKREIQKLEEEMNKPKGAPHNSYSLFLAEEFKGSTGGRSGLGEMSRAIADRWNAMSGAQKAIYDDKLNAMKVERESKMDAWEKKNMSSEKMTELEEAMTKLKMAKSKKRSAASVLKQSTN